MANSFDEMAEKYQNANTSEDEEDEDRLVAGETCPNCEEKDLFELRHERDSQLDTKPHPDAPVSELVCIHCGVQEGYMSA